MFLTIKTPAVERVPSCLSGIWQRKEPWQRDPTRQSMSLIPPRTGAASLPQPRVRRVCDSRGGGGVGLPEQVEAWRWKWAGLSFIQIQPLLRNPAASQNKSHGLLLSTLTLSERCPDFQESLQLSCCRLRSVLQLRCVWFIRFLSRSQNGAVVISFFTL